MDWVSFIIFGELEFELLAKNENDRISVYVRLRNNHALTRVRFSPRTIQMLLYAPDLLEYVLVIVK